MVKSIKFFTFIIILSILFSHNIYSLTAEKIIQNIINRRKSINDSIFLNHVKVTKNGQKTLEEKNKSWTKKNKFKIFRIKPDMLYGSIFISDKESKKVIEYYPDPINVMYVKENHTPKEKYTLDFLNSILFEGIKYNKKKNEKIFNINAIVLEGNFTDLDKIKKNIKLWVDLNTWDIRQCRIEYNLKGEKIIILYSFIEIYINTNIPDSEFEFTPPEGTEIKPFPETP